MITADDRAWRGSLVRWHKRWGQRPGLIVKLFVAYWVLFIIALVLLLRN